MSISDSIYGQLITKDKLTGSSSPRKFHFWKMKLNCILFQNDVEYVLHKPKPTDPSNEDPTSDSSPKSPNPELEKWVADDCRCRHLILVAVDELLFSLFHDRESAKEIMDGLTKMLVPKTLGYRFALYRRYTRLKMAEETPIEDHILELGAMAGDLKLAGMEVSEEMQAVVLMDSLPESWESTLEMIMTMETVNGELKLNDLIRQLRVHGDLKKMRSEEAEAAKKRQGAGNRGFRGNCYNCGRPGHCQTDCPDMG